jgi:hypothetical protein
VRCIESQIEDTSPALVDYVDKTRCLQLSIRSYNKILDHGLSLQRGLLDLKGSCSHAK